MHDLRRRALRFVVLLSATLETSPDERAGRGTGGRRQIAVVRFLADGAADDGADGGAGDRVLILRRFRHRDFFVPALLGGRGRRLNGLRGRPRSRSGLRRGRLGCGNGLRSRRIGVRG